MREVQRNAILPYTAEAMFDLVADVESYPEFLPGCTGATVLDRSGDEMLASLTLSQGALKAQFSTRNRLQRPERMTLALVEGPFRDLTGEWRFEALGEAGCKIQLSMRFAFASRVKDTLMGPVFELTCNRLVDAFVSRARKIYGRAH